jgi:hypothetical protein
MPAEQRLLCEATVDCNALNARLRAQRTEQRQKAHRTVYRTCLVHHRTAQRPHKSELQRSKPNGLLTWLAHRTVSGGAPDCPVRHATAHFQRPFLVLGAINTPATPHSMASKFSTLLQLTRASIQYKTHQKRSNPLPTPHKALVIRESDLSCSFELLRLDCFFSSFILVIKLNCNQGKRHQLCGGPCGNFVFRLSEKRSSLGLSDRLREGKG